jgi:hypothetical protein
MVWEDRRRLLPRVFCCGGWREGGGDYTKGDELKGLKLLGNTVDFKLCDTANFILLKIKCFFKRCIA